MASENSNGIFMDHFGTTIIVPMCTTAKLRDDIQPHFSFGSQPILAIQDPYHPTAALVGIIGMDINLFR